MNPEKKPRSPEERWPPDTEMWIWIPRAELQRIYARVDLAESREIRAFLWPHNDQVKELDLIKFTPARASAAGIGGSE